MDFSLIYYKFCNSTGYTTETTIVLSIATVIFVYLLYKVLGKLKIKIDKTLALAVSPFVLLGSSIRVLKDIGYLTDCIFQTPGIYFLIFGVTFLTILISLFFQKKKQIPYYKITFIIGLILVAPILGIFYYQNFLGLGYVLLFFIPWVLILKFVPWSKENKIATGLQMFDATATFVALNYFGFWEEHVLPRFIINLSGTPFSFIILKIIAVILILIGIDKYSNDKEFNNYIKLIIGILGAATGLRDFISLIVLG